MCWHFLNTRKKCSVKLYLEKNNYIYRVCVCVCVCVYALGVSKLIVSMVHRDADEDDSVSVQ